MDNPRTPTGSSDGDNNNKGEDKAKPAPAEDLSVLKNTSARMELSIKRLMAKGPTADGPTPYKRAAAMANPELLGLLTKPATPPKRKHGDDE